MKKIIPPTITAILLVIFGIVWFFALLVIMNGVMGPEGGVALTIYIVLAILAIVLSSVGSKFVVRLITSKMETTGTWIITVLVILGCSVLGSFAIVIGSFLAMMVAGIK